MILEDYVRVLRKGWIYVVAWLLVGIAIGAALVIVATPKYEAQTRVFVSAQSGEASSAGELVSGTSYAQQRIRSYLDIAVSPSVLQPVIDELALNRSADSLASQISASSPANSLIIELAVVDSDAARAAAIANATASSLENVIVAEFERPLDGGPSLVKLQTIQPANAPSEPFSPNALRNIGLGAALGLIVGLAAAVLRSVLDTRIQGRHDIETLTTAPILGGTTFDQDWSTHPLIVRTDPRNPKAESFRALRTNLRFVHLDNGSRAFVVTSSVPGEGKSSTTANLALALAETGAKVVLVDADLRLPRIAANMGLEGGAGLTDVLIGRFPVQDVLQRWGDTSLYVLPAGQVPPNPSELLGSAAMVDLVEALSQGADYVLLDSPPLLPVTDAAILSNLTAGAILVAATGRVKKAEFSAAIRNLEHANSRVVGVVMTMLPSKGPDAYGGAQYGFYGTETEAAPSREKAAKGKG